MFQLVIIVVVFALVVFGLVKVFDKYLNKTSRLIISIVLWAIAVVFSYFIYESIQAPIKFEKIKEGRFKVAVAKFQEIKNIQQAYKSVKGTYTDNMDSIIKFVENEYFVILERKDTSVVDVERNKAFGIDSGYFIDKVITKEIGRVKVKDSLYKDSDRYKRLNIVKVDGITAEIKLETKMKTINETKVPLFKASLAKAALLTDLDKTLVDKENKTKSVEGIDGDMIVLGSLDEVNLTGNWPKKYGKNE
ncbi:hypothetical protein [Paucihalobacter sp.]|uniref:hypothetical protein n=1 Tax=Paucihalobacter sp. TaxID=2850405 RepID=UPI003D160D97